VRIRMGLAIVVGIVGAVIAVPGLLLLGLSDGLRDAADEPKKWRA
jgi:hypothetical protein